MTRVCDTLRSHLGHGHTPPTCMKRKHGPICMTYICPCIGVMGGALRAQKSREPLRLQLRFSVNYRAPPKNRKISLRSRVASERRCSLCCSSQNAVVRRNTQMSAKERKRKGAKERKRALLRENCKQPGLKPPGLGTPN